LAKVTLNIEVLRALKRVLNPSFVQFKQAQNHTKRSRIHQLMVKNLCRNSIVGGLVKRRNIGCSQTRFKTLICAFLTSPESHYSEQKWLSYIEVFINAPHIRALSQMMPNYDVCWHMSLFGSVACIFGYCFHTSAVLDQSMISDNRSLHGVIRLTTKTNH